MKLKRTNYICCSNCDKNKQARRFAKARTLTGYKTICKLCTKKLMKFKITKTTLLKKGFNISNEHILLLKNQKKFREFVKNLS